MKGICALLLIVLSASLAGAAEKIDNARWHQLQTYDARDLSKSFDSQLGRLVAVRFNFRGKGIHHIKPNWYEGSLWQPDPQGKKRFSSVRVIVGKKDLAAFESITSDFTSSAPLLVYGWVRRDSEANFTFVQLLGRKATVDSADNAIVAW